MEFLKKYFLLFVVFVTGASVLVIEVVAVRILSPYYGNTIFTVSSVISVILAALSFGYYAGGKLADRYPSSSWFFSIILLSGLTLLLFHFVGVILLPILSLAFSISAGPLVSSIFLFLLPALLLGTLSPYTIKLQSVHSPNQGVGTIAGKVFFCSTLGSIFGSLLAGFVLIPNFGINQIVIANGVVLFLLGLVPLFVLGLKKKYLYGVLFVFMLFFIMALFIEYQENEGVVYSKDGVYERITIYDSVFDGRLTRFFQQDRSISGAMFLDSDDPIDLVGGYAKYYALYKIFTPDVKNALVIGGGAYSLPRALLAELPEATVDVSEIEPSLFNLSRKYFRVTNTPRLRNYIEDGRRLLRDSNKKYDLIFSDVYYSFFSVPAHFTTKEFFTIAKEKLSDEGLFIASLIGSLSRQQPSLIMSEIKTFQSVFPNSYFFAVDSPGIIESQNIVLVGHNSDKRIDLGAASVVEHPNEIIRSLQNKIIDMNRFEFSVYPVLTDNFSPVEYLTGQILRNSFNQKSSLKGEEMLALVAQQLRYGPRYLSAGGHEKAQNFILAEMKELAPEVKIQTWEQAGQDGKVHRLTNIIGRLFPAQERRIILGAHYDSKKFADKDKRNPDHPVPGANDSASGVAVLVELARLFANAQAEPSIGIDVVFFDGEEGEENQGGDYTYWKPLGSTYFAEHLSEIYSNTKPIGGIVLDMVCDKDLRILKEGLSVKNSPNQVESFWSIAQEINGNVFQKRVGQDIRDDHIPLNQAGIPSFLLIDFEYPYSHTTGDTVDKCSAQSMETVARAIGDYLYTIE
ncbi:MAG: fused MFS/spermidine synthase [Candidatus Omnitrophica bacterium]|nr:fused MFS/spermidine synthase [Candidatus Omnitrophota bacterium]